MGCSIATCLLIAGHPVIAVAPIAADLEHAEKRILGHLQRAFEEGVATRPPESYLNSLVITEDYGMLKECKLVIECTIEDFDIKKSVFGKIESAIAPGALLVSNTSAAEIFSVE